MDDHSTNTPDRIRNPPISTECELETDDERCHSFNLVVYGGYNGD